MGGVDTMSETKAKDFMTTKRVATLGIKKMKTEDVMSLRIERSEHDEENRLDKRRSEETWEDLPLREIRKLYKETEKENEMTKEYEMLRFRILAFIAKVGGIAEVARFFDVPNPITYLNGRSVNID